MSYTSSDTKSTPRFGSISSPSSYRPSYSGGTYRSAIKRDPTTTPSVTPSFSSKYSSFPSAKDDKDKDAAVPVKKSITPTASKYGSTKDISSSEPAKSTGQTTRYPSTSHLNTARLKAKEAAMERRPAITVSRVKSRDPSPVTKKTFGSRSRDPSPIEPPSKDRFSSSSSSSANPYMSTLNRFYSRTGASFGSGYGGCSSPLSSRSNSSALSYMNANESAARSTRRRLTKDESSKSSTSSSSSSFRKEKPKEKEASPLKNVVEKIEDDEPVVLVDVSVVTRGTSPTLTPTPNIARTRRLEVAKTIEKVIQRPLKRPPVEDKMIQSDRLDDSTKYCRFLATNSSPSASWTNYIESKFSSNGYARMSKGSSSPSNSTTQSENRSKTDTPMSSEKSSSPSKSRESSVAKSVSSSRANSIVSNGRYEKSKTRSPSANGPKQPSPVKQKTNGSRSLPPPVPKESPTKTIPSSSSATSNASSNGSKWANKDFRKSALNVGPSDRPRKTRASSVGSEDSGRESNRSQKSASPCHQRTDRSSSVCSEVSTSSATTSSNAEDISKSFGRMRISPSPVPFQPSSAPSSSSSPPRDDTHSDQNNNDVIDVQPDLHSSVQPMPASPLSSRSTSVAPINDESNSCVRQVANIFKMQSKLADDECELPLRSDNNSHTVASAIMDDCSTMYLIDHQNQLDANASPMRTTTTTSSPNLRQDDTDNTSWWLNSIPYDNDTTTIDHTLPYHGANMKHKLRHIDSGELPWWLTETEDVTMAGDDITLNQSETEADASILDDGSQKLGAEWPAQGSDNGWPTQNESSAMNASASLDTPASDSNRVIYKISHVRSGERAWWMDDNNNNVESKEEGTKAAEAAVEIERAPASEEPSLWMPSDESRWRYPIKYVNMQDDIEQPWWMKTDEPADACAPPVANRECTRLQQANASAEYEPMPLGDRASPEGLEDLDSKHRLSASYNFPAENDQPVRNEKKLYISRFANIDDLLGGSCNPMMFDRFTGDVFEEITPAQVRIHDSTAKMPFIHRMSDDK